MKRFIYQLLGASICMGGFCSQAYAETLEEDLNISDSRLYIRKGDASYGKWLSLGEYQEKFSIISTGYMGSGYPLELQAPQLNFAISSRYSNGGSVTIDYSHGGNHGVDYVGISSSSGLRLKGYQTSLQGRVVNTNCPFLSEGVILANNGLSIGSYVLSFSSDTPEGYYKANGSPALTINKVDEEEENVRFSINASDDENVGYPIDFQGSQFNFSGGNMTVNGAITCKQELKVAEIETDKIRTKDIMADDVKVKLENAADYVFEEGYDLKPLNEVEAYVKRNKHLPGVPSAAEMSKNGVSVSEMSNLLLEKVEELTLRMIEMEKKINQLQEENNRLQQSVK